MARPGQACCLRRDSKRRNSIAVPPWNSHRSSRGLSGQVVDGVLDLAGGLLDLPFGLCGLALGLLILVIGQITSCFLDLALGLVDLAVSLVPIHAVPPMPTRANGGT